MANIFDLGDDWTESGTVYDAIKIDVTDTASDATSKLLDLQIGGTSKFKVDKGGNVTLAGSITGLDQVDNTSDLDKPVSTLQATAIGLVQSDVDAHEARTDNPHTVTATQVGLGNVDNTSDLDKPISTLQATAIGLVQSDVDAHEARTDNPHTVTATQVGLGNVDNTSDLDKPISTLTQAAIDAAGGGAFGKDANTLITPSTPIVLDQATGDEAALTLDYTTNKAAGNDTGLLINQTDTLSPGTSNLLDLQVGGSSKFSVSNTGRVRVASFLENTGGDVWYFIGGGTTQMRMDASTGLQIPRTYSLAWSDSDNASTGIKDLFIRRDAANTLAQRNGINAQTFNIYNTDDGAGNAEWLSLGFSANDATIQVAKSGTGVARPLFLRGQTLFLGGAAGANHWKISTAGNFLAQADNTYDIGAASANRPRNGYFSGAVGLHGVTPPAQASHIADATNATDVITRVNAILVALENIGITAAV